MKCDLAINLIQSTFSTIPNVDIALFAPGWTLENAAEKSFGKWKSVEETFWNNIYLAIQLNNFDWTFEITNGKFFSDFCSGG